MVVRSLRLVEVSTTPYANLVQSSTIPSGRSLDWTRDRGAMARLRRTAGLARVPAGVPAADRPARPRAPALARPHLERLRDPGPALGGARAADAHDRPRGAVPA